MFERANNATSRAKLFLWGSSGSGKTTLAMRWAKLGGKLAVMDLEGGTHRYDSEFEFYRTSPKNIESVLAGIDFLATKEHDFTTLLIDPSTIMWDYHQSYWEQKLLKTRTSKNSKGHHGDFYEIQPLDWKLVKAGWRRLFYRLRNMDLNVIITARSKNMYDDSGGEGMMKKIGVTFDTERGTDYEMDTTLQLTKVPETGQYFCETQKHRSFYNQIPVGRIDITATRDTDGMDLFRKHFGDAITRKAVPIQYVLPETKAKITSALGFLEISDEKLTKSLEKWGVEHIDDLKESAAIDILKALEEKVAKSSPF